jgi:hypothetical protein
MFDSATGDLAAKTDGGLLYNAGTGMLTATGLTGPLTGLASTSTLAATITVIDSTDTSSFIAMFDSATGSLAVKTDGGLTYNAGTGMLTATGFTGPLTGAVTGTASVATVATTVTITDNESTNESNALIFTAGGDVDGGNLGLESDGTLTYNPSTGKVTATGFIGTLAGAVTGDVTGKADTADTLETARTIGGTSFDGSANIAVALATLATTVTITDNESTNENNAVIFTAGGDVDGGDLGLESDGTFNYNPSTGLVTATTFAGALTGNASGTAATVTGAAQTAITSVGTLTALQVDNINIDGNTISSTAGTDLLIMPKTGEQIVLDGTIVIDAGVVTGATSITSTAFVGALTGNADTATEATTITAVANNSTNETVYPTFVDGATGTQGIETDTGLYYNPSTGMLTVAGLTGALTGNASSATLATTLTVTDNEITNENNLIAFVANAATTSGAQSIEMDGTLHYNPSSGKVTATLFAGDLTGDVDGDCTGSAATVTGAAQTNITSVGTLTSLAVGDITSTGDLVVSGTGPHSIGGAASAGYGFQVVGAAGTVTAASRFSQTLTGSVDTGVFGVWIAPTITEAASGTHDVVTSLRVDEPAIVNASATTTLAATVYISSAPTEGGTTNAALYVAAGAVIAPNFQATAAVNAVGSMSFESNILIFQGGSGGMQWNNEADDTGLMSISDAGLAQFNSSGKASGLGTTYFRIHTSEDSGRDLNFNYNSASEWVIDSGTLALNLVAGTIGEGIHIGTTGNVGIGAAAGSQALKVLEATDSEECLLLQHSDADNPIGLNINYSGGAPNGTGDKFLLCADTSETRAEIRSNGGFANFQSNDADLSDARLKEVYGTIDSTWDAVKALDVVGYRYKENLGTRLMVGVTAQQVARVAPDLYSENGWGDEKHHAVHNKDLWFYGIRALQENMSRTEAIEDCLRTLVESNPTLQGRDEALAFLEAD